nr:NEDD4 family-interacting protein 1-like [Ciona intestinalis]|eukprot:XP_026694677.1 NEDD4 family-interacting protein 1-like [Ciona intestinalis]
MLFTITLFPLLQLEQTDTEATSTVAPNPPDYDVTTVSMTSQTVENPEDVAAFEQKMSAAVAQSLPSYEQATSLPTYEDTQRQKENEARQEMLNIFFNFDADTDNDEIYLDGYVVGNDCMFMLAFLLAFFFNWLGFFIGYCILLNLSGRYGAMSGFGLSVVNWLMYLKYTHQDQRYFHDEKLFMWWFFFLIAVVLFMKGILNWMKVRKMRNLSPEQRQSARLFFY